MYRYYIDDFYCWTQILSGLLQTALYVDFLYYYFVSLKDNKPVIELPM
jgi:ER lumen protein retaining receptor